MIVMYKYHSKRAPIRDWHHTQFCLHAYRRLEKKKKRSEKHPECILACNRRGSSEQIAREGLYVVAIWKRGYNPLCEYIVNIPANELSASSHQYVKRPQICLLLDPKHHLLMHGVKEKKRWPIFIWDSLSLVYRWIPYPNKSKSGNMRIMTNHETWKASSAEWLDLSETQGLVAVSNLIVWKVLTCHVFFGCWDFWKLFEFALPFFISSSH